MKGNTIGQTIEFITDPTGAVLTPGKPETCQGNGKHDRYEICCDECDFYLKCFPESQYTLKRKINFEDDKHET